MSKPISILCEEFKSNFANLINDSHLPACVIETILENYLKDIKMIVKSQYESDLKNYEKQSDDNKS